LRNITNPATSSGNLAACHKDLASGGCEKSAKVLKKRRFSRAIAPQQAYDLARGYLERDVIKGDPLPIAIDESLNLDAAQNRNPTKSPA
jgi:hypothetical protein